MMEKFPDMCKADISAIAVRSFIFHSQFLSKRRLLAPTTLTVVWRGNTCCKPLKFVFHIVWRFTTRWSNEDNDSLVLKTAGFSQPVWALKLRLETHSHKTTFSELGIQLLNHIIFGVIKRKARDDLNHFFLLRKNQHTPRSFPVPNKNRAFSSWSNRRLILATSWWYWADEGFLRRLTSQ